jgi:hypothetical protein
MSCLFAIPMTRLRLTTQLLALLLTLFISGCETFYEDRFELTPPESEEVILVCPGVASVRFIQTASTSSTYPAKNAHLKAVVTRLNPKATGSITMLLNAYLKTPLTSENLGFTQLINATELSTTDTVSINLGKSYSVPLKKELLQLHILDAGWGDDEQSKLRGSYSGIYAVEKDDEILMKGSIYGVINYKGETTLEVSGVDAFRFVTGFVGPGDDLVDVYYSALDQDGKVVAPLSGVASVKEDILSAKLHLSIPQYDILKITVTKNQ